MNKTLPLGGDPHHVLADSSVADDRTRVLKHGDTFAVFDHLGHLKPGGLGEEGLYHEGTRYLSLLILELDGQPPFFLGSTVRDQNDQLSVALTNPDRTRDGRVEIPLGTLHLAVRTLLWQGVCHWRLRVRNHGPAPVDTTIQLRFRADFADIFEVRGMKRTARGHDLSPEIAPESGRVVLGYVGLDEQKRRTVLRFSPAPAELVADRARFRLSIPPHEEVKVDLAVACQRGDVERAAPPGYEAAQEAAGAVLERFKAESCRVGAADGRFDAWLRRSESDLHMMTSDLPTGPYPYAGVPWFNTPFGRDGIITALQCLWLRPELARGVLAYLAATQAIDVIPAQDAEPGKILHETRNGEMATLGEMPFGRYYGSVDATPLFVLLAGAYYERTADRPFAEAMWPHVEAALAWIDRDGDRDGDGFVEYERRAGDGLIHQGWKDSDDALSHADGTLVTGPIALCEVQAYVYAARRAGAVLARALGKPDRAAALERQGEALRIRFEAAFWQDDLGTYALALDGTKRPCHVRASNAGHCLFGGIAAPDRAARVARGLMSPESFSGWGIRTLAATEVRFNPMAYHNGTVWPHDNALIAYGASRYGLKDLTVEVLAGLFAATTYLDLNRMPELFCGFGREPGEGPVLYPVACAPQAWAASSVFLLLQACLGLGVSGVERQVWFHQPRLPSFVPELRITNLSVAGATVDLLLVRHGDDVGVNVLRRVGDLAVVVAK
ncbi:amylo-alpha-1,6-glucosidase [Singulisphaera acidiphila]|uniref:Glycogen debranching enzyme n=1 Tax=Singulisphaera acidiphila (strain ATCC BAA-1392 / DSM 18658 / VKM B-2454 / MOB10) TaxID=886293 RepID=L0DD52_SINAD|nr:amylo-alpha-1,6-glucosidase [Singulisphaera acidiphila]AGA27177.1 glycogen debranching enzyme [Singulisphaera acidiphila DSM 18658]